MLPQYRKLDCFMVLYCTLENIKGKIDLFMCIKSKYVSARSEYSVLPLEWSDFIYYVSKNLTYIHAKRDGNRFYFYNTLFIVNPAKKVRYQHPHAHTYIFSSLIHCKSNLGIVRKAFIFLFTCRKLSLARAVSITGRNSEEERERKINDFLSCVFF